MKITVNRSRLLEGLKKVQAGANAKSVMPVYGNVKIDAMDGKICLTTTNGEISMYNEVECAIDEAGSTTAPMRLFLSVIDAVQEGDVSIEEKDGKMKVKGGSSVFKVGCIPASEFPALPNEAFDKQFSVPASVLKDLFRKTAYAQSVDDTRKTLQSVLLDIMPKALRCVATDGRRLAVSEAEGGGEREGESQYIIPCSTVGILQKFLEGNSDVSVGAMKSQVVFSMDDGKYKIYTRIIEGAYPDYMKVIPENNSKVVPIDRLALIGAVERVSVMAMNDSASIKMTFASNLLTVEVKGDDMCDAKDEIPVKYDGEPIEIIFNPRYVLEPLRAANADEVTILMESGLRAAILKSSIERFLCVLMPLRVH